MPIYLDDQAVELAGGDLQELLQAAKDHLAPSGRVVIEVQVDGEPVLGEDLEGKAQTPVSSAEVRLYTADPWELACSALDQVAQTLGPGRELAVTAAEAFQRGDQEQAMQNVGSLLELWQQGFQVITQSVGLVELELDDLSVDGQPWSEFLEEMLEKLRELRRQLVDGDNVALADALAYEWPELITRYESAVGALSRDLADRRPA